MSGNQDYGVAMGVKRGKCQESGCSCGRYKAVDDEEGGGVCLNCGHFPGNHENLGIVAEAGGQLENGKIIYADSDPLGLLNADDHGQENGVDTRSQLEDVCEWSIGGNELKFLEKLGSGRSATVYKGLYKNITVAIKVLKESLEPKELANFKGELDIMSKVKSNHVVNFYGGCLRPKICLVMEYCSNGSLFHLLQRKEFAIQWPMFFRLSIEMAKGVQALHSMHPPVVHRDLKSLNLLVNSEYQVKVCDFGLSRYTQTSTDDSTLEKLRGTYAYSAPEVYFGEKYSTKSDVFSIGVILWEIISRVLTGEYQRPYKEFKEIKIDFQIIIASAKKGRRPTIPALTPPSLMNLVTKCWDAKPENRPSVDGVLDSLIAIESEYHANTAQWDEILLRSTSPAPAPANNTPSPLTPTPSPTPSPSPSTRPSNNNNNSNSGLVHSNSNTNINNNSDHGEEVKQRRMSSLSRSASKIFLKSKIEDKKEEKISVGQPQWQHRTAEELLGDSSAKPEEEKKIEIASSGWKHFGHDDWKSEDAFDDDKKKDKKKGILGRLMKKEKKKK